MIEFGRRGFTLLEVLVALTVGGTTVLTAATLLHGLAGRAGSVTHTATTFDRSANADRLLRHLLANLDLSPDTATPSLGGSRGSASFVSWCHAADGTIEQCTVSLVAQDTGGLRLGLSTWRDTVTLFVGEAVSLRFLREARTGGVWVDRWTALAPPRALGVVRSIDTLVYAVRGGG